MGVDELQASEASSLRLTVGLTRRWQELERIPAQFRFAGLTCTVTRDTPAQLALGVRGHSGIDCSWDSVHRSTLAHYCTFKDSLKRSRDHLPSTSRSRRLLINSAKTPQMFRTRIIYPAPTPNSWFQRIPELDEPHCSHPTSRWSDS